MRHPNYAAVLVGIVMLPLAVGGGAGAELYQGLGSVIVGGLLLSTLFTLFVVPVLLSIGHDLSGVGASERVDEVSGAVQPQTA